MNAKARGVKTFVRLGLVALGAAVTAAVVGVIAGGYLFAWSWAGLESKTLWDWLNLLIGPAVVAVVAALVTAQLTAHQNHLHQSSQAIGSGR